MAESLGSAILTLKTDSSKFNKGMDKAEKKTGSLKKEMGSLQGAVKKLGGVMAATFSVGMITKFATESVRAFGEQEQAIRKLTHAAEISPILNGNAVGSIRSFADELQEMSTVGDEATERFASMLASMDLTEGQIKETITAASNLSAAMGISMEQAVRQLSKSYSGMRGELGEMLPFVRELSKEQLKSGEAIDVVNKKFRGMAEEMRNTTQGSLKALSNAFGDLQEDTGRALSKALNPFVGWLTDVISKSNEAREEMRLLKKVMQEGPGATESMGAAQIEASLEGARKRLRRLTQGGGIAGGAVQESDEVKEVRATIKSLEAQLSRRRTINAMKARSGELTTQEQKKLGKLESQQEAVAEAMKKTNKIATELLSPLEKQRKAIQDKIDELVAQRQVLKENNNWLDENNERTSAAQKMQSVINELVSRRAELEKEIAGSIGEQTKNTVELSARMKSILGGPLMSGRGDSGDDTKMTTAPGAEADRGGGGMDLQGRALSALMSSLKSFAGFIKQIITSSKPFTTMMEKISSIFTRALGPAINAIVNAISRLLPGIETLATAIGSVLANIFNALIPIVKMLTPLFDLLAQVVRAAGSVIMALMPAVRPIINLLIAVLTPILQVVSVVLKALTPFLNLMAMQVKILAPLLRLLLIPVQLVAQALMWLYNEVFVPIGNKLQQLIETIGNVFIDAIRAVINGLNKVPFVNLNKPSRLNFSGLKTIEADAGIGSADSTDSTTGGGGSSIEQKRPINVTVDIYDNELAGSDGFRELAVIMRNELESLGVINQ